MWKTEDLMQLIKMVANNDKVFWNVLLSSIVVWAILFVVNPSGGQSRVFFSGSGMMSDYLYPRLCAEIVPYYGGVSNAVEFAELKVGNGWKDDRLVPIMRMMGRSEWKDGFPDRLETYDCCYPPICMAFVSLFPVSHVGSIACTLLGATLFVVALLTFARAPAILLSVFLSAPMLFGLARGQLVFYSAAGAVVFLAWWDSESRAKRLVAAIALAFAVAFKLTPAIFGVLYLTRGRWWRKPEPWLAAIVALILLFTPFFFYGGEGAFFRWLANASENRETYTRCGRWGLLAVERTLRIALGLDVHSQWPEMGLVRMLDVVLGLLCLWRGWQLSSAFLIAAAMLMLPGNMMFYTGIYMIPALLADGDFNSWRHRKSAMLLSFMLLTPLQVPPFGISHTLADCAFLGLVLLRDRGRTNDGML